ncbi:exodeoxyribonuclease VII large subunit [Candidatus Magnetomorum sp. HK-1]|nr:exodeoxyribonuclease VII large subunit [Candidatus Magnetomorum sp. HK-1]
MKNKTISANIPQRRIFSVSEITRSIRTILEQKFPFVWISGEISNFRKPTSGHYYFTLKDKMSQINTVMFRGQNRQLKFDIEDGLQINGMGRLTVYEPYGNYQIILEYAEPVGLGALQLAFEQLKTRLSQEGLFNKKYKQSLPFIPDHISVVTSPQGAVIHDIMNVVKQRFPRTVQLVPVNVQGQRAADEIVAALKMVNAQQRSQVIILARGGGSLEDLQAFNEEKVARAVFSSAIPVVSAIGHETDYTIVDFVADLRAPTPSAAAALIVPERRELVQKLNSSQNALFNALASVIHYRRITLKNLSARLKSPRSVFEDMRLKLDDRTDKLIGSMQKVLNTRANILNRHLNRMIIAGPQNRVVTSKKELNWRTTAFIRIIEKYYEQHRSRLNNLQGRLNALDPYAILKRGYSVTRALPENTIVKDAENLEPGQHLEIMLASGSIEVTVERINKSGEKNV